MITPILHKNTQKQIFYQNKGKSLKTQKHISPIIITTRNHQK